MPLFLATIHRPAAFDPATLGEDARAEISALNAEMVAADVRRFVGGLRPASEALCVDRQPDGTLAARPGVLDENMPADGFWILELPSPDIAEHWGRKAAAACRASVVMRQLY